MFVLSGSLLFPQFLLLPRSFFNPWLTTEQILTDFALVSSRVLIDTAVSGQDTEGLIWETRAPPETHSTSHCHLLSFACWHNDGIVTLINLLFPHLLSILKAVLLKNNFLSYWVKPTGSRRGHAALLQFNPSVLNPGSRSTPTIPTDCNVCAPLLPIHPLSLCIHYCLRPFSFLPQASLAIADTLYIITGHLFGWVIYMGIFVKDTMPLPLQ